MDSALSLVSRLYLRQKVRIYKESGFVRPFENPWKRLKWFLNHPRLPSKFKEGDICRVVKKSCEFFDKEVRVHYASGNHIECVIGPNLIVLKQKDLKWIRNSKV